MSPRRKAELSGAAEYTTGKTCKHGHVGARRTDNGYCLECRRVSDRARYARERQQARCYRQPGYYFEEQSNG